MNIEELKSLSFCLLEALITNNTEKAIYYIFKIEYIIFMKDPVFISSRTKNLFNAITSELDGNTFVINEKVEHLNEAEKKSFQYIELQKDHLTTAAEEIVKLKQY